MIFIDSNPFIYAFYKPKKEALAEVDKEILFSGQEIAIEKNIDLNDGIAITIMQNMEVCEIYSFDSHFDNFKWIRRITK